MYFDLHIHTNRYSACSILYPTELIEAASILKLDGIVIVEHGIMWDKEEVEEIKRHPLAKKLIVLRGQEVRTRCQDKLEGDVLVFGVGKSIESELCAEDLIQKVHENGGVAVAAHPYRWGLGLGDNIYKLELDGIEVLNGNSTPDEMQQARDAQKILQLAGVGGSDAHSVNAIGNYLTHFSVPVRNEADLVAAIKEKKCRPAYYEELSGSKK